MTVYSQAYPFRLMGEPAELRVVRNQGYCWGEVNTSSDAKDLKIKDMQVESRRDLYGKDDDEAAEVLIQVARSSFGDH